MPTSEIKRLWIGIVEVRPLGQNCEVLKGKRGAFVNIVTWASDPSEYRRNAEKVIGTFPGLFVSDVTDLEPVADRRARIGRFGEEIEDMISRAEDNSNAIIFGTFHTFERDEA